MWAASPLWRFLARGEKSISDPSAGSPMASPCSAPAGLSLSPWCLSFPQHRPVSNHCLTSDGATRACRDWRAIPSCLHSCFGQGPTAHWCCWGSPLQPGLTCPRLTPFFLAGFNRR